MIILRSAGILLHITSLPSEYGIGTLGQAAYDFVDFLKKAGQKYWQVLPVGPTGYGDSPYQSASGFACNPYFIDLDILIKDGLITADDIRTQHPYDAHRVDYGRMYHERYRILRDAYSRFKPDAEYESFIAKNKLWLDDYALFMAIKDSYGGKPLSEWDDDIRLREPNAVSHNSSMLAENVNFYKFMQYEFDKQWMKFKKYANDNGIRLIGDMPIYLSDDSAEIWTQPQLFCLDKDRRPRLVAGCPPDAFSAKGQLWGNPVYDWDAMEKDNYKWWVARIRKASELFDMVRIDHFRGFESFYAIPAGSEDAVNGEWIKGPDVKLFEAVRKSVGDVEIIAEDLGFLTDEVHRMLDACGYPGMKILQFAFNPYDDNTYLPHNYPHNCIAYTGTHDNSTVLGWFDNTSEGDRRFAEAYLHVDRRIDMPDAFIRALMSSVADTVIVPIQDWLGLDDSARMNTPATNGQNWQFRVTADMLSDELAAKIAEVTHVYRRDK